MATDLLNGCSYSDLWVSPKNWKTVTSQKSLAANWYVECKFYDPFYVKKYPKGFSYRTRLNRFKTLEERKEAAEALLKEIPTILEEKGFNPITRNFMMKPVNTEIITPDTRVIPAFREIHSKLVVAKSTFKDLRQIINNVEKSIVELKLNDLKISEFKRGQVKTILDNLNLTNAQYNKFLTYLSILIRDLVEMEAMEHNPISDIRKKKTVKKIREVLEVPELLQISQYLKDNYYEFYRYKMIFFHSGARSSELFRVQAKDVNLIKQEYKVTIQKGAHYKEVMKVIMPDALPFWIDLLKDVKSPEDYIFSRGLKPGTAHIEEYQITKRWKRLVKDQMCFIGGQLTKIPKETAGIPLARITSDFYAMKHLFLDLLDKSESENSTKTPFLSKCLADHTTDITEKVYLVGRENRKNNILKKTRIDIFPINA